MSKKIPVSVSLAITLLAITITFAFTWLGSMEMFNSAVSSVTSKQAQFVKLGELDTYVRGNYYGEIDDANLNDRIAQGYMNGLGDKYAAYYTEKEYTEQTEYDNGDRVGVGIEVVRDADGFFRILRVHTGSPAEAAGVEADGRITSIGGQDAKTITTLRAMNGLLRDRPGTELTLTCLYDKADERTFTFQRVNYIAPTVEYTKADNFAYIRIAGFERNTATEFSAALQKAQAEGARGVVFDVRGNPGGMYAQVYTMVDQLAPLSKAIAYSENKSGITRVLATSDEASIDLPFVVIANNTTSAAAELFAVSVRDLCGGSVVGMTTAGKGMLQSAPQRLADGSAVVVTVAKLLTSKGESFDTVGVVPDVEVVYEIADERALINPNFDTDQQIVRSLDLLRSITGLSPEPAPASSSTTSASAPEAAPNDPGAPSSAPAESTAPDEAPASGESTANDGGQGGNAQGENDNSQGENT